jgi:hypothetical protein
MLDLVRKFHRQTPVRKTPDHRNARSDASLSFRKLKMQQSTNFHWSRVHQSTALHGRYNQQDRVNFHFASKVAIQGRLYVHGNYSDC